MTEATKPNRTLRVHELVLEVAGEGRYRLWSAWPEAGTTIEEMKSPLYWAQVANKFHDSNHAAVINEIKVISADHTWRALLYVEAVVNFAVSVRVESEYHYDPVATSEAIGVPDGFICSHNPVQNTWFITRTADKAVVVKDAKSREAAIADLNAQLRLLKTAGEKKKAAA